MNSSLFGMLALEGLELMSYSEIVDKELFENEQQWKDMPHCPCVISTVWLKI